MPLAVPEPSTKLPDRLGTWWLAPTQASARLIQRLAACPLLTMPVQEYPCRLGFGDNWEAGNGRPDPEHPLMGSQWALCPTHPWVESHLASLLVIHWAAEALREEGTLLVVASWRSDGVVESMPGRNVDLAIEALFGHPEGGSPLSLPSSKTRACAMGVGLSQQQSPAIDLVGLTIETMVGGLLREVVTPEQKRGWVGSRRAWQLNDSLPAAQGRPASHRF